MYLYGLRGRNTRQVFWFLQLNQSLLPGLSAQTITPLKTASSLLDFLISCHRGHEVEPWTVFNVTPEEVQTVWSMLERHKSLYDYRTCLETLFHARTFKIKVKPMHFINLHLALIHPGICESVYRASNKTNASKKTRTLVHKFYAARRTGWVGV